MIDEKEIFNEVHGNISIVCPDDCVGADLAAMAGRAISNKARSICVNSSKIADMWPWLEKAKTKIIARFIIDGAINESFMSDLSIKISSAFRDGADGAIIFMDVSRLRKFAAEISSIRDDLFFNKSFGIGLDITKIDAFDWENLFGILKLIRADSLCLVFDNDTGNKSDFVGRVFAALNANRNGWDGNLNFMFGQNIIRIDQTYRLIQQMMPGVVSKTEFFIDIDMA